MPDGGRLGRMDDVNSGRLKPDPDDSHRDNTTAGRSDKSKEFTLLRSAKAFISQPQCQVDTNSLTVDQERLPCSPGNGSSIIDHRSSIANRDDGSAHLLLPTGKNNCSDSGNDSYDPWSRGQSQKFKNRSEFPPKALNG